MADIWDEAQKDMESGTPAPGEPDVWDQAQQEIDDENRSKDAELSTIFRLAQDTKDNRALALTISRELGADVGAVERNLPEFRKMAERARFDPAAFRREAPGLYDLMIKKREVCPLVVKEEGRLRAIVRGLKQAHRSVTLTEPVAVGPRGPSPLTMMLDPTGITGMAIEAFRGVESIFGGNVAESAATETTQRRQQRVGLEQQIEERGGLFAREKQTFELNPLATESGGIEHFASIAGDFWRRRRTDSELNQLSAKSVFLDSALAEAEGLYQKGLIDLGTVEDWRQRVYDNEKAILELEQRSGLPQWYGQSGIEQTLLDVEEGTASQVDALKGMGAGGVAGAGIGALVGARAGGAPGARAGAMAGLRLGIAIGGGSSSFVQETGSAYRELKTAKTDAGDPVDPAVARGAAVVYGVVAAGIEVAELGWFAKSFGPLGEMIRAGQGKAYMQALMADVTKQQVFRRVASAYAKGVAGEGVEEGLQEAANTLAVWGARSVTAGAIESADTDELAARIGESVYKGGIGAAGGLGLLGAGVHLATYEMQRSKAIAAGEQVAAAAELASTEVARAAPQEVAQMVRDETDSSGQIVSELWVDPARLVALFTEQGLDPDQAISEIMPGDGAQRMRDALDARRDEDGQRATLRIPVGEYVEQWGGKALADALVQDTTTRQGMMTRREVDERSKQDQARIRKRAKQIVKDLEAQGEWSPRSASEAEFVSTIRADLEGTGHFSPEQVDQQVAVARAVVETLAQRLDRDPDEVMDHATVRIRGELQQETVEGPKPAEAPTIDLIRKEYLELDPETQAARYYLDENTGLLNVEGLRVSPRPEDRPALAVFDLEGFKFLNDRFGHLSADGALRAMAGVLRQAGMVGAKRGGSLVAWVKDDAEAQELARKMGELTPQMKVVASTTAGQSDIDATLDAAFARQVDVKEGLRQEGAIGHRKGPPAAAVPPGAPAINYELRPGQMSEESLGVPMSSPEAQAAMEGAAAVLEPVAQRLKATPAAAGARLGEAQLQAFEGIDQEAALSGVHEEVPGMLTEVGFKQAQRLRQRKFSATADMRLVKELNRDFGREETDAILAVMTGVLAELSGQKIDAAHLHGDEFAAQHDDRKTLDARMKEAQRVLERVVLVKQVESYKDPDTGDDLGAGYVVQDGIHFAYGIARTFDEADHRALPRAKAKQRAIEPEFVRGGGRFLARRVGEIQGNRGDIKLVRVERLVEGRDARGAGEARGRSGRRVRSRFVRRLAVEVARAAQGAADSLRDETSALSEAAGDLAAAVEAARLEGKIPRPQVDHFIAGTARSQRAAWDDVVAETVGEDHPSEQADGKFRAFEDGRGERPPAYPSGLFGPVDREVGIRDPAKGVSGAYEAFRRLSSHYGKLLDVSPRSWDAIEAATGFLSREIDGYQDLRLPERVIEARRDELADAEERFYQERLQQPERGWVDIAKTRLKAAFRIVLTEKADVSTPLHELAHTYLEMLSDIARRDDTPAQIKQDYQTALKYLGAAEGSSISTEQKENWARSFESYLLEGRAPSLKLAEVFQRLRSWMIRIYKTLTALPGVELNDDIRGVFDRLLATDEEIEAMQEAMGVGAPLWASGKEAGQTEEWYREYRKTVEKEGLQAALWLHREVAEARRRAMSKEWRAEVKQNKAEAEGEWNRRRDVRAHRYLRRGEITKPDTGELLEDLSDRRLGKLDRRQVRKAAGPSAPRVERALSGRLRRGGEDPAAVAAQFGFGNAREMFGALLAMPAREEWIRKRAEEITREKNGLFARERDEVEMMAARALHLEGSGESLIKEGEALFRLGKLPGMPSIASIREAAKELAAQQTARTISVGQAISKQATHARKAVEAMVASDFARAGWHKMRQILAHFMYRELDRARADREKFHDLVGKFRSKTRRSVLANAGKPFVDAAEQILEAMGVQPRQTDATVLAERTGLVEALGAITRQDMVIGFDQERLVSIVNNPPKGGWKDLTVADIRLVRDALQQLYTAAREINTIVVDGRRVELEKVATEIATDASMRPDKGALPWAAGSKARKGEKLQKGKLAWQGWWAAQADPRVIFGELGPTATKVLWHGYLRARQAEDELTERVSKEVAKLWDKLPREMRRSRYDAIDDTGGVELDPASNRQGQINRQWMWMVALNMGNASNIDRLTGGYGWDEDGVRAWLDKHMTKEEWDFVQGVWDLFDRTLYPEMARVYRDVNGIDPEKIDPIEVQTKHGLYRGGYFPARYDPAASRVGEAQSQADLEARYAQRPGKFSVSKSFTKERSKTYTDVVVLDWGVVPSHVIAVNHYVAFERFVRDAGKLVNTKTVNDAVLRRLGKTYKPQIDDWLSSVATFGADSIPASLSYLMRPVRWARQMFTVATLGFSAPVALGDLTNGLVSWAKGDISLRDGTWATIRASNPLTWTKMRSEALAKSPELRHRLGTRRQDMRRQLQMIGNEGARSKLDKTRDKLIELAFYHFDATDTLMSTIIWDASYRGSLRKGLSEKESAQDADDAVQAALPSGTIAEQPAILRERRGLSFLLVFFTYFSKLGNLTREMTDKMRIAWSGADSIGGVADAMLETSVVSMRLLALLTVSGVLPELISGRGPDEGEEPEEWFLRKTLSQVVSMIPLLSTLGVEEGVGAITSTIWHGEPKSRRFSPRLSPVPSAIQRLVKATEKALDQDEDLEAKILAGLEALGMLTVSPTGTSQFKRTAGYALSQEGLAEDVRQGDVAGVASGLIYGKREGQPANPLTPLTED